MNDLEHLRKPFSSIGWFIPPYVSMGFLSQLAKVIHDKSRGFTQLDLEQWLALIHPPEHLAAMVTERYSKAPFINEYKTIISEAIDAHFTGLHHVAVAGLLPVIEGVATKLADHRKLSCGKGKNLFANLARACKEDVIARSRGSVGEIVSMLDSFIDYANSHLYTHSDNYLLSDNTNRNGILHGAYTDNDYGTPINFYKAISAVDVHCFLIALSDAKISWLSPSPTEASRALANHYISCVRRPHVWNAGAPSARRELPSRR